MTRARSLVVAACLALAPPAGAAKVILIVADESQARAAGSLVSPGVGVLIFDRVRLADPIEKGRFLAALQRASRIVSATGGRACGWLSREIDDVPVQCFLPYNGPQVLDYARAAGWRRVAAVRITGYEKVYLHLRDLARKRGIALSDVPVGRIRDLTAALPPALENADAVWILGDTLLTEGAAFDYLVENSLTRRIPLIAPGAEHVARGAFLGADNDGAALIRQAAAAATAAAAGAAEDESVTEVPGGRLTVNRVLARRWGIPIPGGAR